MTGHHSSLTTQVKAVATECKVTRCVIHLEILVTKKMFLQVNSVQCEIMKIVNYVKSNPLNSTLFAAL